MVIRNRVIYTGDLLTFLDANNIQNFVSWHDAQIKTIKIKGNKVTLGFKMVKRY